MTSLFNSGMMVNCVSVLCGGVIGAIASERIPDNVKEGLPVIFGISAFALGVSKLSEETALIIPILALITGYIIGEVVNLDAALLHGTTSLFRRLFSKAEVKNQELLVASLVMFCFGTTGILGIFEETLTGSRSLLMTKSILDFFTAMIFASIAGWVIAFVPVIQITVFFLISLIATQFSVVFVWDILANFLTTGAIMTMIVGTNICGLTKIKTANTLPTLVTVIILSMI